jgi:hypothetical protein
MAAMPDGRPGRWSALSETFSRFFRGRAGWITGGSGLDHREYAALLLLTGFFLAILAVVLAWGGRRLGHDLPGRAWIRFQPELILLLALWLAAMGAATLRGTVPEFSRIRGAVWGYAAAVLTNGLCLGFLADRLPITRPLLGLAVSSLAVGGLLVWFLPYSGKGKGGREMDESEARRRPRAGGWAAS